LQPQRKINWWLILFAAVGFALGVFIQDWLVLNLPQTPALRWWVWVVYALWGISLVITTRNWKTYLLYAVLVVIGFLSGRYIWVGVRDTLEADGLVTILYLAVGLLLGLFLAIGHRWQQAFLLALTAVLAHFIQSAFPYPEGEGFLLYLADMLHFAFVGGVLCLAFGYLGLLPAKVLK
jgi:hypothetical protein